MRNAYTRSVAMLTFESRPNLVVVMLLLRLNAIVAAKFIIRKSFRIVMEPTVWMERKFLNWSWPPNFLACHRSESWQPFLTWRCTRRAQEDAFADLATQRLLGRGSVWLDGNTNVGILGMTMGCVVACFTSVTTPNSFPHYRNNAFFEHRLTRIVHCVSHFNQLRVEA